jgi:hypothetical protein
MAEGAIDLDIEKTRQDPRRLRTQTSRDWPGGGFDGRDDAVVDGHRTQPAIFGSQQMAEKLDHRVHITFA